MLIKGIVKPQSRGSRVIPFEPHTIIDVFLDTRKGLLSRFKSQKTGFGLRVKRGRLFWGCLCYQKLLRRLYNVFNQLFKNLVQNVHKMIHLCTFPGHKAQETHFSILKNSFLLGFKDNLQKGWKYPSRTL